MPATMNDHSSPQSHDQSVQSTLNISHNDTFDPDYFAPSIIDSSIEQASLLRRSGGSCNNASLSSPSNKLLPLQNTSPNEWNRNTRSSVYLILLNLGSIGLQIAWGIETSYGSPFLLSLGISKSFLSLIWIAGPLSGVIMQPYVGIKSDRCRSRWGKRRPFIAAGAITTTLGLYFLAWSKPIIMFSASLIGLDPDSWLIKSFVIFVAVLTVYILDFAINALQAALRAIIVDCVPAHQQDTANAWAFRLSGLGHILCFEAGSADLPKVFHLPFMTQFQALCFLGGVVILLSTGLNVIYTHERSSKHDAPHERSPKSGSLSSIFRDLYHAARNLSPQVTKVCMVQFMSWLGWFPFLFYSTTYVGGIYVEPFLRENPSLPSKRLDELWVEGTRFGANALLIYAFVALFTGFVLPWFIQPVMRDPQQANRKLFKPHRSSDVSLHETSDFASTTPSPASASNLFSRIAGYTKFQRIPRMHFLTLRRCWFISHLMYAGLTLSTFFISSVSYVVILVALVGIPWAVTMWAPFALIAADISSNNSHRGIPSRSTQTCVASSSSHSTPDHYDTIYDHRLLEAGSATGSEGDRAGVVLGIHNVAVSLPQIVATLICSIIFKFLQKPRGAPYDDSIAWTLRFGGFCALWAAYFTLKIDEPSRQHRQSHPSPQSPSPRPGQPYLAPKSPLHA